MNLTKLFTMQKELDDRIRQMKGLENTNLIENTILALQVELGELANAWRGFKHWSNDQKMRREQALEEYVDCLHFALSIGNEYGFYRRKSEHVFPDDDAVEWQISSMLSMLMDHGRWRTRESYKTSLKYLISLGYMLGFTSDEIYKAYIEKNTENHARQDRGY